MIGQKNVLILPVIALSFIMVITCFADDWSVATGGNSMRYSCNSAYGPESADILWQGGATSVIAWQPVIDGETVVMARCEDLGDELHGTLIVAYDLATGTELWTKDLPVENPTNDELWRNRVSAINDGKVYASRSGEGYSYMYALDISDGSQIWRSEGTVNESTNEGAAFAPNGDLIVGNYGSVMRINATDGTTIWTTPRPSPTSGGSEVAVYDGKVYGWKSTTSGPAIEVYDIDDGQVLYESDAVVGGSMQQVAPFIGPDGTVYAPRTQNSPSVDYLVAYTDTGTGFIEKWRTELGYVPFASFGVGPDGSVYSYNRNGEIVRLNPDTGAIIDTSLDISAEIGVRIAIDGNGLIFATADSVLYSFNPDLSLRWQESVPGIDGPAIAYDGTLIVNGSGTNVIAYEGEGSPGIEDEDDNTPDNPMLYTAYLTQNYPNPFVSLTTLAYVIRDDCDVNISVYNLKGQMVQELVNGEKTVGEYSVNWDAASLTSGIYVASLRINGKTVDAKRMVLR